MTCKAQIITVILPQNAISPRLEQALKAVELAFDTGPAGSKDHSLAAIIEARAIRNAVRLTVGTASPRRYRRFHLCHAHPRHAYRRLNSRFGVRRRSLLRLWIRS
jgi:hypothetical protein